MISYRAYDRIYDCVRHLPRYSLNVWVALAP